MADEGYVEVHVSTRKEREARRRSRLFAGWQRVAARREAGWDLRLLRIWGGALVVSLMLPLAWSRSWRGSRFTFLWDALDGAALPQVIALLLPVALGAVALAAARHPSPKLRGVALLVGSLVVVVVPPLAAGPAALGALPKTVRSLVAIVLVGMLAAPAIAGANRVSRRTDRDALCRILVGVGGVAMLLALFLPIGPKDESLARAVFEVRGPFSQLAAFPAIGWLLILLAYAVVAAVHLHPRPNSQSLGAWLSVGARLALLWLPAMFLLASILGGFGRGFFPRLFVFLGATARLYGVLILTAVGFALVLGQRGPASKARESADGA